MRSFNYLWRSNFFAGKSSYGLPATYRVSRIENRLCSREMTHDNGLNWIQNRNLPVKVRFVWLDQSCIGG